MRTLSFDRLVTYLEGREDVVFAAVFGSARDGELEEGSDVDLGVCFLEPLETDALLSFLADVTDCLQFDVIDLVDVSRTNNPILAFEAISGHLLCRNDIARTAEVVSLISREYEDAMVQLRRVA